MDGLLLKNFSGLPGFCSCCALHWAVLVVPIRANEPNGFSVQALLRESIGSGGCLQVSGPSFLYLPFPALPAETRDCGLFVALTTAMELGATVGGHGCHSPLQLHLRAGVSGAKLGAAQQAMVSGWP